MIDYFIASNPQRILLRRGTSQILHVLCIVRKLGQNREGVVRYWPPKEHVFLFLGFLRLCQVWWKSIKKCDRESARRRTDSQTDRRKPIL